MKQKQYRITWDVLGKECVGQWRDYNEKEFLDTCKAFAINNVWFTMEFQTIENEKFTGPDVRQDSREAYER